MSKLLVVHSSIIVQSILKTLLDEDASFNYDIVETYGEAQKLLDKSRYEFAVIERVLKDAKQGEIIALLNKYNIAPLVFTSAIDEDFFESFEGAKIVDYVQKISNTNIYDVLEKLKRLKENKKVSILLQSKSKVEARYLKENLSLHGFKIFIAETNQDVYEKIELHPELSLLVLDADSSSVEMVHEIRSTRTLHELKILAIVEEPNLYLTSQLLHGGANDYLIKNFSRDELYIRVYQNIK